VKVIGLDIATRTGWCRWDGEHYVTGVLDCSPREKDEPDGMRFLRMQRGMHYLLADVDACVIERTYSKGSRTAEVLNGLTAIALSVMELRGLEYAFVGATALKKFASGSGRAGKADMIYQARAALMRDLTDDEADAYWLVRYWQEHMQPMEPA
jgi:Holliday junction resolvasome RuvABC endonuclease subunit